MNIKLVIANYLNQVVIPNWPLFNKLIRGYGEYNTLKNIVIDLTPELNDIERKFTQRIEWIVNNRTEFPRCKYCNNPKDKRRDFISLHQGYRPTCGRKECVGESIGEMADEWWSNASKETIDNRSKKIIATKVELGIPLGWNEEKSSKTYFNKTGYRNPSQNPEVKELKKKTCMKNYGVEMFMCTEEFLEGFRQRENQKILDKLQKDEYVEFLSKLDDIHCEDRKTIYKWKCKQCGREFEDHIDYGWYSHGQVRSYARCPKCYPKEHASSLAEKELYRFLKENTSGYNIHINEPINRNTIDCGHLDIILENKSTGKIDFAFEFNGLYWHQRDKRQFNVNYHYNKTIQCEKIGIRLMHVWEDEWMNDKDSLKNEILDYINGVYSFDYKTDNLILDRSKFCKLISPNGFKLISETKPSLMIRTDGYSNYEIYDCGTLIYQKDEVEVYEIDTRLETVKSKHIESFRK